MKLKIKYRKVLVMDTRALEKSSLRVNALPMLDPLKLFVGRIIYIREEAFTAN